MSKFGWDLPPGCTQRQIDELCGGDELPCPCCGHDVDACICPECPTCGAAGDPDCYTNPNHHMYQVGYNIHQHIGQSKLRIAQLQVQLDDEKYALSQMEQSKDERR